MRIKALCSFSGAISMAKGDVLEYDDPAVIADLAQAGYIQEEALPSSEKAAGKGRKKKAVTGNENQ